MAEFFLAAAAVLLVLMGEGVYAVLPFTALGGAVILRVGAVIFQALHARGWLE